MTAPDPSPASDPLRPDRSLETRDSLERSLRWRSQVLFRIIAERGFGGDCSAVVESLKLGATSSVRQLPAAAQRALEVSHDPDSTIEDLVNLFENDPTLTQALLKRANSAWYRRHGESIESIFPAVRRIGAKAVETLLLEKVLRGLVGRPGGALGAMAEGVWEDMIRISGVTRSMAPAFGVDAERAYALSLLSDVGKLVVFDHIADLRKIMRRDVAIPDDFLECLLHHVHEPLSGLAALRWGMGEEAAFVVAHHHRHPVPESSEPFTETLYVADAAAAALDGLPDWDAIWSAGGITREREPVERIYAEIASSEIPDEPGEPEEPYREAA